MFFTGVGEAVTRTRECSRLQTVLQYKQDLSVRSRSRYCDEDTLKEYHIKSLSQRSRIATLWRIRQIKKRSNGTDPGWFPWLLEKTDGQKITGTAEEFPEGTWG